MTPFTKRFVLAICLFLSLFAMSWATDPPGIALETAPGDGIVLKGERDKEAVTYNVFCLDPGRATPSAGKVKFTSHKGEAVSASKNPQRLDAELLKRAAWIARQTDYTRAERQEAIWALFRGSSSGSSLAWSGMTSSGSLVLIAQGTGTLANSTFTTTASNLTTAAMSDSAILSVSAVGTVDSTSLSVPAVARSNVEDAEWRAKVEQVEKRRIKLLTDSKAGAAKIDLAAVKVLVPASSGFQRYLVEDDCR